MLHRVPYPPRGYLRGSAMPNPGGTSGYTSFPAHPLDTASTLPLSVFLLSSHSLTVPPLLPPSLPPSRPFPRHVSSLLDPSPSRFLLFPLPRSSRCTKLQFAVVSLAPRSSPSFSTPSTALTSSLPRSTFALTIATIEPPTSYATVRVLPRALPPPPISLSP